MTATVLSIAALFLALLWLVALPFLAGWWPVPSFRTKGKRRGKRKVRR